MARILLIAIISASAIAGVFFWKGKQDRTPVKSLASQKLPKISPTLQQQKLGPEPYLMLHLEDIKKCFPILLTDARPEDLVVLEDVMVEVEKVFLPAKPETLFRQLKFEETKSGQEYMLRLTDRKTIELFQVSEEGALIAGSLPEHMKSWPETRVFRHFAQEFEVLEEEVQLFRRGRGGEQITTREKADKLQDLEIYAPAQDSRLECSRREPKAILCLCRKGV